mmetsp:Transcript_66763/g.156501  ORF Transcript_66763/g.156501 Transcript_66763/m.156501 type:complete len:265 (-) Transcript_66763:146-940(-)
MVARHVIDMAGTRGMLAACCNSRVHRAAVLRFRQPNAWRWCSTSNQAPALLCDRHTSIDELAGLIRLQVQDQNFCIVDCTHLDAVYWALLALHRAKRQTETGQQHGVTLYMVPEEAKSEGDADQDAGRKDRETFHPRLHVLQGFEWNLSGTSASDHFLIAHFTHTALAAGLVAARLPDQGTALAAGGIKAVSKAFQIVMTANKFLKRRRRLEEGKVFVVSVGREESKESHRIVLTCGLLHAQSGMPDSTASASRLDSVNAGRIL